MVRTRNVAADREAGRRNFRKCAGTLAAATLIALVAASCSGRVEATVRADSSARIALRMDVPEQLSQRIRQFGNIPADASLFDLVGLRKDFGSRKTFFMVDVATPDLNTLTSVLWIPDLKAFAEDRTLVPKGLIAYSRMAASGSSPALRELRVSLSRGNASAMVSLFPGFDRRLVDNLSPPALETDPLSPADYRANLETVIIGKKYMPAFDACRVEITVNAPRPIVASAGGIVSGQSMKVRIPLFDLLTLERPVEFWMRWAE